MTKRTILGIQAHSGMTFHALGADALCVRRFIFADVFIF